MTEHFTDSWSANLKILLASGIVWFYGIDRIYYGGPLALLDSVWGFIGWTNISLSFLTAMLSLIVCFVVLKYLFRPFVDNAPQTYSAGRRGAEAALKMCVIGIAVAIFEATTDWLVPSLVTWTVVGVICSIWILCDFRRPTFTRLAVLMGFAWAAWLAHIHFIDKTTYLHTFYKAPPPTEQEVFYRALQTLASPGQVIIETAIVGFFVGLLCTRQKFRLQWRKVKPFSRDTLSKWWRKLFFGENYSKADWFLGNLTAVLLVASFLALHSIVFQGFQIWPFRLADLEHTIPRVFVNNAVHHLPTALWSITPFVIAGAGLTLTLSRFRLTGVLPIIGCGALLGLLWSQNVSGLYRVMFLEIHVTAILGGMIIAAGFGVGANSLRTSSRSQTNRI